MTTTRTRPLDDIDWLLLDELQRNARMSLSELGRRVRLSIPSVGERVRRLEDAGVIAGYHAAINPEKIGLPLRAFIRLTVSDGRSAQCRVLPGDLSRVLPEIVECHRITGDDCYILKAQVASMAHLEELIGRVSRYGNPTTAIVLSSPLKQRPLTEYPWPTSVGN